MQPKGPMAITPQATSTNEEPPDLWDEGEDNGSGMAYLDVSEIGAFVTKAGKAHVGLMEAGHQWPDIRWWNGRDALIKSAPWLIASCAKEDLVEGARFPFAARVYYTKDANGYKVAERFEQLA